jgi:PIN domain nuclease of toxin-antitoxin system
MMSLLLDTHAFLWWIDDDPRLGRKAREAIAAPGAPVAVSVASVWEIAIKTSLGKLDAPSDLTAWVREQLTANAFSLLPISLSHATAVRDLPFHHRDPFDRLLFAQALGDDLVLVTVEGDVAALYGVPTIW